MAEGSREQQRPMSKPGSECVIERVTWRGMWRMAAGNEQGNSWQDAAGDVADGSGERAGHAPSSAGCRGECGGWQQGILMGREMAGGASSIEWHMGRAGRGDLGGEPAGRAGKSTWGGRLGDLGRQCSGEWGIGGHSPPGGRRGTMSPHDAQRIFGDLVWHCC